MADIAAEPDGRSFPTTITHGRYTLPSSASILTGKYPGDHGIGYGKSTLDDTIPTVAEAFTDAGYRTALVSNNHFVGPETGLARGFETTTVLPDDAVGIIKTAGIPTVARWLANIFDHSAGLERDKYRHSGAYLQTSLVRQQLDAFKLQSEPFFLYAHYNQTHRPYYPPLRWFDRYDDTFEMSRSDAGDFSMDVHRNLVEKVAKGCPFTDDEWWTLRALYDAQLEYNDTFIGQLYEEIQRDFDETIFVVTSDHGEHLGERGALGHKYVLDDYLLRVPLVTSGLDVPSTEGPVQHSDVMRTLLERAHADSSFVDGVDLQTDNRKFAVTQDGPRDLEPIYDINPNFEAAQFFPEAEGSLPQRTTVRSTNYRFVRGHDGTDALFAIPNEKVDRSGTELDVARHFDGILDNWLSNHRLIDTEDGGEDDNISDTAKSRLKKMGYLESEL